VSGEENERVWPPPGWPLPLPPPPGQQGPPPTKPFLQRGRKISTRGFVLLGVLIVVGQIAAAALFIGWPLLGTSEGLLRAGDDEVSEAEIQESCADVDQILAARPGTPEPGPPLPQLLAQTLAVDLPAPWEPSGEQRITYQDAPYEGGELEANVEMIDSTEFTRGHTLVWLGPDGAFVTVTGYEFGENEGAESFDAHALRKSCQLAPGLAVVDGDPRVVNRVTALDDGAVDRRQSFAWDRYRYVITAVGSEDVVTADLVDNAGEQLRDRVGFH
jgi:hypothetical protein